MKIGLISDIHGNLQALSTVLAQLYAEHVDMVLCIGDLVCYGAHNNAVIELLRSCGIPSVAGSYDAAVAWNWPAATRHLSSPATEPIRQAALTWAKQNTHSKHKDYLKSLPFTMRYQLDGLSIHLLHAGLEDLDEWHTPEQPDHLALLATRLKADVVVLGHTHQAFVFACHSYLASQALIINPGAVGHSLDGDTRAAYAIFDTVTRNVVLKRVVYDLDTAVRAVLRSGMPMEIADLMRYGVQEIEQVSSLMGANFSQPSFLEK